MSDSRSISIIVPARNAEKFIEACLAAISKYVPEDRRETIVVDNGSSDRTVELASRFPVRIISQPDGFVSAVRNTGARAARHDVVAFVDADCTVKPGWFDAINDVLADTSVGVTGCRHALVENPTWCERVWALAHSGSTTRRDVPYIPAGNLAVRRDVFRRVNGFDETLQTGEDPDLCDRIASAGFRILQDPRVGCVHLGEPKTLAQIYRRERWHGRGARFRYAGGRLAPVTVATIAFAISVGVAVVAGPALVAMAPAWALAAFAAPAIVPAAYTLRHVGRLRNPAALAQLWLIYLAYFLGRAAALPVVLQREHQRQRLRPSATVRPG